ncbi:helix-turn-helix transcriptional regulator [Streptomyces sp. NBC_01485]|uniref:LuxR family transcriptional regulator AbsR2 n=1 Tax=Streptomyces sp. NBC_01485 TaxID=2903884 RepID=UPI002E319CFE|nr:LuxR C-terminal-related transcriptional regulator [Streptomyces sp. NBC_01485]
MPTPIDVTTYAPQAGTLQPLRPPWPFTGRDEELELVRRSLAGGRPGIVLTGPAGCGRTRLALEAVRGTDCARAAGTPETRGMPFAAFAHLLPENVTLHRAVQLLSSVRLLLVDDAHLLDDASAALLHQLAVQGRTRLLVLVTDGAPAPGAVSRLWTGELLPRLALEPLPHEESRHLLTAGAGGPVEPLTVNRMLRLCRGDLRLLRDLLDALRERDLLTRGADTDAWTWRGRVPVTPALRERAAAVLARACPDERETLDRLAFAEPLPLPADALDLRILEHLEADGLLDVTDDDHDTTVRLAHPLHGPVLRAAAGRLRARRLTGRRRPTAPALDTEAAELTRRIERADVRTTPTPVGEWLVAEGEPVPPWYAAVRARFSRLRGELREAAAWAREGLAEAPHDHACRTELALAAAQSGETGALLEPLADHPGTAAWPPAARGDLDTALKTLGTTDTCDTTDTGGAAYDAVRLGAPERAVRLLPADGVFARHARALARGDGPALDLVAAELEERGFLLFAAEAHAQAASAHRDPSAARTARTRAVALARRCQGARTPALSGLVLGELTARQRQIVTLAAAGLSNRQIAERLTLSVRTVGNHLYGAYTRLGAGDRGALPWLVEQPA